MLEAISYARVSTEEQAQKGLSIQAQEEVCRAFCLRNGWPILATHRDEGLSAGLPLSKRPGLQLAIGSLAAGDHLVIAKRDRIFRAEPAECVVIERAVLSRGARIVSAAGEGTGDDEPASVLMRRLLDGFAEYERLIIKARTKAVLDSKRGRSERVGTVPYGQRLVPLTAEEMALDPKLRPPRRVEPDPEELRTIGLIRLWRQNGRSLRQIAACLTALRFPTKRGGPWNAGTICRILKRHP